MHRRRAKIIATVGPASRSPEMLAALGQAGGYVPTYRQITQGVMAQFVNSNEDSAALLVFFRTCRGQRYGLVP